MKSTGIVRRIDDLGRVVVPKELRRTLGIREGDPLEIFVDGDRVVLQKYVEPDACVICLDPAGKGHIQLMGCKICNQCCREVYRAQLLGQGD